MKRLVPKQVFNIKQAIENGMSQQEIEEKLKNALEYIIATPKIVYDKNNVDVYENQFKEAKEYLDSMSGANDLVLGEPSLTKLKSKGRINDHQYQALCTGDKNDILLAFNLELF